MKRLLFSLTAILLFAGCNKDKGERFVTPVELAGKWSSYEYVENGTVRPVSLAEELSYWEFNADGKTYIEYDYYNNRTYRWEYSLENNVISTPDGSETLRWPISNFTGDAFTLQSGNYRIRFRRSQNQQMVFLAPSVNFGATAAQIKQEERRMFIREDENGLGYGGSNAIEQGVAYLLENGRMNSAALLLSLSVDPKELVDFLQIDCKVLGQTEDFVVFESRDAKYQVILGVEASGVMLVYIEPLTGRSKIGDADDRACIIEQGRRIFEDIKHRVDWE